MSRWRRMFVSLGLAGLACYGGVCLLLYAGQGSMLYFPDRNVRLTPADVGLPFRDVEIPTEDGLKLHGWAVPAGEDRPWVLFSHGNAGNLSHRLGHALLFRKIGANALFYDYRGYGRSSPATPTEVGLGLDAEGAWRHLVEQEGVPPEQIVLMGESLGGGVSVGLASRRRPAGLVLECTFTSVPDVGAELYPWLPVRWLARNRFPSRDRLAALEVVPKLIMHGRDDEIIPFHHGRDLFEAAAGPKEWLELPGGHNVGPLERGPDYLERLKSFIERSTRS